MLIHISLSSPYIGSLEWAPYLDLLVICAKAYWISWLGQDAVILESVEVIGPWIWAAFLNIQSTLWLIRSIYIYIYIERERDYENAVKSSKPRCLLYMAVWPDVTQGKCSYGYLKISILTVCLVDIFCKCRSCLWCMARIWHMWLVMYLSYRFRSLPAGCVCVRAARGASAISEKNTPLELWNMYFMDLWFLSDVKLPW